VFFIVEQQSYMKKVCPNGHLDMLTPVIKGFRYCPECGEELRKEAVPYNIYRCSRCGHEVEKEVTFCPYCGERKEARQ